MNQKIEACLKAGYQLSRVGPFAYRLISHNGEVGGSFLSAKRATEWAVKNPCK